MCLIRGLRGLAPCPVCTVPLGTLSDLKTRYPYRVAADIQALVNKVERKKDKEAALKPLGIRAVEVRPLTLIMPRRRAAQNMRLKNALWDIANSDVHQAVSFDRLHAYLIGLLMKHFFPELKAILEALGRAAKVALDEGQVFLPIIEYYVLTIYFLV